MVGWTEPQTHPIVPVYWFHLHSDFAEFPWFRVTPHDSHGGFFSDDSNPPLRDPIVGFGGFGAQGSIPCPGEVSDVELPGLELPGRHSLRCFRNPATDSVGFALDGPLANWGVDVYDVTGAKVHSQPRVEGAEWIWDLKDAHGDRIPTGVYFARLRDASAEPVKFTVLR